MSSLHSLDACRALVSTIIIKLKRLEKNSGLEKVLRAPKNM